MRVYISPELEVPTVLFNFGSRFLVEVCGYYVRFWWWNTLLHTMSGFLLGMLGFLLVYVLNEKKEVELKMKHTTNHLAQEDVFAFEQVTSGGKRKFESAPSLGGSPMLRGRGISRSASTPISNLSSSRSRTTSPAMS